MNNSRTLKAGILSFGQALTKMVGLLSAMVLARLFTKEDYATYRQSLMVYMFAAPLLTLGLPQAIYYFMPNQPDRKRNILINNISVLAFTGAVFTAFLLFGGASFLARQFNNPELTRPLRVMAWYPLFFLPVSGLSACLMIANRIKLLAVYNVCSRLVMLISVVVPVFIWQTPFAGISGYVLSAFIVLGPALWLMMRAADTGRYLVDWQGIKAQLKFAVPLGLATMIGQISLNLDKILVSKYFDPEVFAVYVNGAMEIPLIAMITGSASAVMLPDIVRMMKNENGLGALDLWKRAAAKSAIIIFPVLGFMMVMAPEIMSLLYGARYTGSAVPFRIYLLLLPIRIAFFGTIFIGMGRSDLVLLKTAVGFALNVLVSLFLIKNFGYTGAAWGTVFVNYGWATLFSIWFMCRSMHVTCLQIFPLYQLLASGGIVLAGSCMIYGIKYMLDVSSVAVLLVTSLVYGVWIVLAMYFWGQNDVRYYVNKMLHYALLRCKL